MNMKRRRQGFSLALIFIMFFGVGWAQAPRTIEDTLGVHFLDVGQADALFLSSQGQTMLVDAGNKKDGDDIIKYLKEQKVKKLNYLVITHPHADHIGGMQQVVENFPIENIIMTAVKTNTQTYAQLLSAIAKKKIKIITAETGKVYALGSAQVMILAPRNPLEKDLNDSSIVMLVTHGKMDFLLTGDAQAKSEKLMLAAGVLSHVEVLKVAHHGGNTSTTETFLQAVSPDAAVISVGAKNSYGHPTKAVLDRLAKYKLKVYRTDQQGTIIASSNGKKITWKTLGVKTTPKPTTKPTVKPTAKPTAKSTVKPTVESTAEKEAKP